MGEVVIAAVVSVATGLGLWAVLPRGVVLTRSVRAQNFSGDALYDTWDLKNDSALPVRVTSVAVMGPHTYDDSQGKLNWVELPPDADGEEGVALHFDDSVTEMKRLDQKRHWSGTQIPPGDTLGARVLNNRDLRIRYRRAGVFGVLERREVRIHGGV